MAAKMGFVSRGGAFEVGVIRIKGCVPIGLHQPVYFTQTSHVAHEIAPL